MSVVEVEIAVVVVGGGRWCGGGGSGGGFDVGGCVYNMNGH